MTEADIAEMMTLRPFEYTMANEPLFRSFELDMRTLPGNADGSFEGFPSLLRLTGRATQNAVTGDNNAPDTALPCEIAAA